jgi:choline monooxygenase
MDADELREEILRFDPAIPIEEAWFPPKSWYLEPRFAALERRALWARSWQPACRLEDLAQPGSYSAGCTAGEPWVVTRGEDGEIRAFANACRHKGREVVTGCGKGDALVCGYHAWRYDLDGKLRSAPRMAGIRDFDREQMSLPALACATWGPWVWINPDPDARPLAELVRDADQVLQRSGWERLRFHSTVTWDIGCNWKVYIDNYLDGGYHIPHMHPTLDDQLEMDSYRTELFEELSIQTSAPGGGLDGDDGNVRIGEGAIYAWLFPNFMLNRYGPCLDTNHVVPLGPDRCRVHYEFFFDPEVEGSREFVEASVEQSGLTQREDIEICESVQQGLGSSHYDRGRYAPRVEIGEHHFHQLLARRFRETLGA